jgi:hypothetical protein
MIRIDTKREAAQMVPVVLRRALFALERFAREAVSPDNSLP